jgi:hypothetical protein
LRLRIGNPRFGRGGAGCDQILFGDTRWANSLLLTREVRVCQRQTRPCGLNLAIELGCLTAFDHGQRLAAPD